MHVPAEEAARLQQVRDPILYDIEGNERENIAAQHPDIVERLARHFVAI